MSLTNPAPCLPALWEDALLVYFRAYPDTRLYPGSPFDLLIPGRPASLVVYDLRERIGQELICATVPQLQLAVGHVCTWAPGRRVVTIHALSLLGRLARWHHLRTGQPLPSSLVPPALVDLVDRVNAPAALAYSARMAFRAEDYTELLQLIPEAGVDRETGLLLNLLKRYGN